jgi:hypothetical protein
MTTKLDEMWAALEAHEPKRGYVKAWRVMCRKQTDDAAWAAHKAAPEGSAARAAAWQATHAADLVADAAAIAAEADDYAQDAIDAIKEVKP